MNKKVLLFLLMVFTLLSNTWAQGDNKITLKGIVVDQSNNNPIPFANIGLIGTVAGVATAVDGQFELTIPNLYATHVLRVSAIGYAQQDLKVYDLMEKKEIVIRMAPVTYTIGTVNVVGELLIYKKMIQQMLDNISKNYIAQPFSYTGYYKDYVMTDNQVSVNREAVVQVYDATGYKRENVAKTFKAINYRFQQVRSQNRDKTVPRQLLALDELLLADIVRNKRNILDIELYKDFRLQNKGVFKYEGDSVQIINFSALKPDRSNCGIEGATSYEGEVYINTKDKALLKSVVRVKANSISLLGRNIHAASSAVKSLVAMTITTNYKKLNGSYFFSGADVKYKYSDAQGQLVERHLEFITTCVNKSHPEVINGRNYFDNLISNLDYWNNYTVYFEGEE